MSEYKQYFWAIDAGTGDIGAEKRAKIAKAAVNLNRHHNILVATSAGGRTDAEAPEIALTFPVDINGAELTPLVEKTLADNGIAVKATLQPNVRYHTFGHEQLRNISDFTNVESVEETYRSIDKVAAIPTTRAIPPKESSEGFSLTAAKYRAIKEARGDAIKDHITSLANTFQALSKETNSNTAVLTMIASGLITIGSAMWKAYAAVEAAGSLAALVSGLVAAVGGIGPLIAIVAVVLLGVGVLWLLLKDAVNVLLVANGEHSAKSFSEDYIKNGERRTVVENIEGLPEDTGKKDLAYPCAFYIYQKKQIFRGPGEPEPQPEPLPPSDPRDPRVPIGFYGSCFGVTFARSNDGAKFSVGMDCPNSILGGTNCIRATTGDAKAAAQLANDSGYAEDSVKVGTSTYRVARASKWGSVNYGICILDV